MKKTILAALLLFLFTSCIAQDVDTDSSRMLDEVMVRSFEQHRQLRLTATSVSILGSNTADRYNKTSLVNGLNTVPGVRMEERSPGSYRINIRGSSLRSPFGVRNIKVYWNDIPVTDPGGNTYFNQFAWNNFSSIEIFKGPAGSMYGAGTGGLILLNPSNRWQPGASLEYITGSYNLQNVFATARFGKKENRNQFSYAHNETDGYRVQTKMRRDNFTWQSSLKITDKQQLAAAVLFTDMYYQTPGALTLAEFIANPKNARLAGGGFPSAVNARAAIFQKNITAGFTNTYKLSPGFKNITTLYAAFTQIKNSAIRNYERRNEPGFGGRTSFTYTVEPNKKSPGQKQTLFQAVGGSEFQQGFFNTQVSKNKNGNPDTLQTNDDIKYTTWNLFIQGDLNIHDSWLINTGVSINKTQVEFSRLSRYPVLKQSRSYQAELVPRISVKKILSRDLFLKATVSRGFSPPTIAELLPSTGVISTELEAEYGWNYESAIGYELFNRSLQVEATGFYFKLNNALVQRRDVSGADFFVNAGDVKQKGIELNARYSKRFVKRSFIDHLQASAGYSYNHFRYGSFIKGSDDFSNKTVPSVPANIFSAVADVQWRLGIYSDLTYYSASKIFLNDANTAFSEAYHLLGCRIGWKKTLKKKYTFNFYTGADNLLDENYSLGNDINAAANRFYNAAPRRNYYAGLSIQWERSTE